MPDLNLPPPLTAPSLAALMPPPALLELLQLAPGLAPRMEPEPMSATDRLPFEIDRARRMMGPAPAAPAATPSFVPPERPGLLDALPAAVARVLAVLGSPQPAQAAAGFLSEDAARRERERSEETGLRDQFRREQREEKLRAEEFARADERFIKETAMASAMTGEREERAAAAAEERERRVFDQQMRKTLGEQAFAASQAELQRIWESKRDEERRKLDKEKLDLQQQQQRNQLSQFYLRSGVKDPKIRKELVAFEMGEIGEDRLSPAALKAAQAAGKTAGGTGGGSGRVMVELVDAQGNVISPPMPYSMLKFEGNDIQGFPGVTPRFLMQQQQQAAAKPLTREDVRAALKAGKTPEELRASARTDEERKIIEAELSRAPQAKKESPPTQGPKLNALGRAVKRAAKGYAEAEPIRPSQAGKGPGGVPILR